MELLPTISQLILYFFAALLIVVIITFLVSKTKKHSSEEEERINLQREKAKLYLRNHPYYAANKMVSRRTYTQTPVYTIPTYSNELRTRNRSTAEFNERKRNNRRKEINKSEENERYSVLNGQDKFVQSQLNSFQDPNSFSSIRNHHHLN